MRRTVLLMLALWWAGASLSGCEIPATRTTQTPVASRVVTRTPPPAQTSHPLVTATATPASDITVLTWWMPEFMSPKAAAPAGPLVGKYLADFEAGHDGKVRVNPVLKARYGKGGLLDYLRTAMPIAPSLVPDIIALDVAELEQAVSLGLLQPLDGVLPREITPTLYAFAWQEGQFDGRTMAVPLIADVDHAIYNRDKVSQPPSTWMGVIAEKIPYLFPVGSPQSPSAAGPMDDVQHAFIAQYVSAGATFDPKTRRLALQDQPLLRVLNFYRDASEAGLLPKGILDVASLDDAWNAYTQDGAAMADVSARRYLVNRDSSLPNTGFAPAPGWSNPVTSVGGGWALAITTPDPARQKAAAEFIAWLLAPERAGPLAQATGWLPTSPKALATWGANPYYEFLDAQLASAIAHPTGPEYAQTAARLQKAVIAVLKGASTPAEAVQTAVSPK